MFLQSILLKVPLVPLVLTTAAVVGDTMLDPVYICEECVVVSTDTELGATDQDLIGYCSWLLQIYAIFGHGDTKNDL